MAEPYVHPDAWSPCGPEDGGGSYPFLSPSSDIRLLLADLALAFDPAGEWSPPLRVVWIAGLRDAVTGSDGLVAGPPAGPPSPEADPAGWVEPPHTRIHPVDLVIRDGADAVIFDSTTAAEYAASDHGPYLRVHRWRGPRGALRATQRTRFPSEEAAWRIPDEVRPANGILDPRTYERACRRVASIAVEGGAAATGVVSLRSGYNVDLVGDGPKLAGIVRTASLTVSAVAGSGEGRAPCDAVVSRPTVVAIGGATADARGRLQLRGDGCYRVLPDVVDGGDGTATLTPGRIRLENRCEPCCSCAGYVDLASALFRAYTRLAALAATAESSRDGLAAATTRWRKLLPPPGGETLLVRCAGVAYDLRFVDLVFSACNLADACEEGLQLTLIVTPPEGSDMVPRLVADGCRASATCGASGETPIHEPPAATAPRPHVRRWYAGLDHVLTLAFDKIQPRSTAEFRLRFEFSNVDAAEPKPVIFTFRGTDSIHVLVPPRPE